MNSKFYVSLEAARLLKEKGYNEVTNAAWNGLLGEMRISPQIGGYRNLDYPDDIKIYSAPTKAEAIDWLESKGMLVWTEPTCEDIWMWFIISPLHFEDNAETNGITYPTRLEAEEAAIIKALELL